VRWVNRIRNTYDAVISKPSTIIYDAFKIGKWNGGEFSLGKKETLAIQLSAQRTYPRQCLLAGTGLPGTNYYRGANRLV
jgi:hypothetical protein